MVESDFSDDSSFKQKTGLNNRGLTCDAHRRQRIRGQAMKMLEILPRDRTRLYSAMLKKQAEIRRSGRGTFSRASGRKRNATRWTHIRYKGSINLEPGPSKAVEAIIRSPDRGDEARLAFRRASVGGERQVPVN
jgi:hypothetical protein